MKKEELLVRREIAKRMIDKNIYFDKIVEISGLSETEVKRIQKIKQSYVGRYDTYLRKKYASLHHLIHRHYTKELTLYFTGVDLDKSEFYKNKLIQNLHFTYEKNFINDSFFKLTLNMQKQYKANLRFEIFNNAKNYIDDFDYITEDFNNVYDINKNDKEEFMLYSLLARKIKKLEYEKIILELFSFEIDLVDIALICDVDLGVVEQIKEKNSLFFSKNKCNFNKLEKELLNWEYEVELEIAKRTTLSPHDTSVNYYIFNYSKYELEKMTKINYYDNNDEFKLRKSILEKFSNYHISLKDVTEIIGIDDFNLEQLYYEGEFNEFGDFFANGFGDYFILNGDKNLIMW